MPDIYSFLQTVYHFVASLAVSVTKRLYRTAAVFVTSLAVVTVICLYSVGFAGAGRNAAAPSYESGGKEPKPEMIASEEEDISPEACMEVQLTASNEQGQQLIGSLLERNLQDRLAKSALEIEELDKEVLMQTRQAAQEAEEKKREEQRFHAVIRYTEQDYRVLQKIVQAEAGICDEKGKILVANVIINRVKSSEFPDNITDVVYERSQFSPVTDGRLDTCQVTQQTIDCVDRALAGEDYSDGALYFMNRKGSTSSNVRWFDRQLTFIMRHENHEFFK